MKNARYILFAFLVLMFGSGLLVSSVYADDYVDDIYYSPEVALKSKLEKGDIMPTYDKKVREIVFIEDTISQPNDTVVRAIIRE